MKKILMLVLLTSALVLSCGKDKDKEEKSKEIGIVGTWYWSSVKGGNIHDCQKKTFMTFNDDKTCINVVYGIDKSGECVKEAEKQGTYTISGNQLKLINEKGTQTATFSVSGNTLTMTYLSEKRNEEITIIFKRG